MPRRQMKTMKVRAWTNLCPIQKRTSGRGSPTCQVMKPKLIGPTETIVKQLFRSHVRIDDSVLGTWEAADVSLSNCVTLNSLNKLLKG